MLFKPSIGVGLALGGGGLRAPRTPTITGTPQVGSVASISAPGATSIRRIIGGVDQGAESLPYTYVADDCGPLFSLKGVNAVGTGPESNRVQTTWASLAPDALYDRQGLTLVSGTHVSAQVDSSGNGHTTMAQATDANRAFYGPLADDAAPGYINGIFGINYEAGPASNLRGPTIATLLSDASKIWVIVPIRNATAAGSLPAATSTTLYDGQNVIGSVGNHVRLSVYKVSGAAKLGFWATGATLQGAEVGITAQVPHLVRARKNGTTVGLIVDGAMEVTAVGSSGIAPTSEVLAFGYNGTSFFSGVLGDVVIWNTPPSANVQATAAALASYIYSTSESSWS